MPRKKKQPRKAASSPLSDTRRLSADRKRTTPRQGRPKGPRQDRVSIHRPPRFPGGQGGR